tara:strand:+ start:10384 stop:10851 length:468 start_codon:yes stop_codon:yes gene_type:complete
MFSKIKYHYFLSLIFIFGILTSCQLQDPDKNHGILFLENRSKKISINNNNKNDILKIFGHPHYISVNDENTWVYFERILSKGKYHKLGKHTLKENNTLVLKFDKFGVLKTKNFFNKNDIKKLKFSKMETENKLTKKSFIEGFLQSVKQKMYGSKK